MKQYFQVCIILSCIFVGILIGILLTAQNHIKFEDAALGEEMVSYSEYIYKNDKVQCETAYILDCLISGKERTENVLLWIGNSQLHTINNPTKDSKTAPALATDKLRENDLDIITITQPNLSLRETEIIFKFFLNEIKVKYLILPLVFDDTREANIDPYLSYLASILLNGTDNKISHPEISFDKYLIEENNENETIQDISENKINRVLSNSYSFWDKRSNVRSSINFFLYKLRNTLFGINSQSVRKLIPKNYNDNFDSFKNILHLAVINDVKVLSYIAPIRNDYQIPYNKNEYEKFISESSSLIKENKQIILNLQRLIPNEYWGMTDATDLSGNNNIDFMHFQEKGHILLERAITKILLEQ